MRGFQPAQRATQPQQPRAGMVRGPGTGTSDEVADTVPEGTYIMPTDSTQAIGEQNLAAMGQKPVPVQLSNGEFKLPPEQVHAVGVQALDQMKNATHAPVPAGGPRGLRGFQQNLPGEPRQFFNGGGVVEEEKRLQTSPSNTFPGSQLQGSSGSSGMPHTQAARIAAAPSTTPVGLKPAGQQAGEAASTGVGTALAGAFPGTVAATKGVGQDIQQAYKSGGVGAAVGMGARTGLAPAIGFADDVASSAARALNPAAQALKTLVTGDASPIGQSDSAPAPAAPTMSATAPTAVQPVAPSAATAVNTTSPSAVQPTQAVVPLPESPQPQATQVQPGVFRSGNSFSDSAAGAVAGAQPRGLPTWQNNAAAEALAQRSQQGSLMTPQVRGLPMPQQMRAPTVAHSGNDFTARQRLRGLEMAANGIHRTGKERRQAQAAYQRGQSEDLAAMTTGQAGAEVEAMRANSHLTGEQMRQAGATERAGMQETGANNRDARRAGLDDRKMSLEEQVRGFDIRSGERQENMYRRYDAAKTPEERMAIAQQIRDLSGKSEQANRYTVVPGGQEWDTTANVMRNVPGRVLNNQTGQFVQGGGQSAAPAAGLPKIGEQKNGYRYKGGNPNDQANWERA